MNDSKSVLNLDQQLAGAAPQRCPACDTQPQRVYYLAGHFVDRCPACGVYLLAMAEHRSESILDRSEIEGALRELRLANCSYILKRLASFKPLAGCRLLDVGCSSGWFLELASQSGCQCYGIEPDGYFYSRISQMPALAATVHGVFPRDLPTGWEPFDIISFNDVFEHIREPELLLDTCRQRLAPDGFVVLSIPSADGFVFRLTNLLYNIGFASPIARMFQINYPFPHLYYFTRRSLVLLAERSGFEPVLIERLRSFSVRGAMHRARMDRSLDPVNSSKRYMAAAALVTFALFERLLPPDNLLVVLRPKAVTEGSPTGSGNPLTLST